MSDGKGKIVDGMSYQSTLPEAYAKVKHERDNVVEAFNKLKARQREVEAELAELRTLVAESLEAHVLGTRFREIQQELLVLI